jgi:hypothetical protein
VETIVRPSRTGPIFTGVARRPRRWPWILVAVLDLIVLAAVVWLTNVEPLHRGSVGYGMEDHRVEATQHHVDAFGVSGTVIEVEAPPEQVFTYRFSLRNDGPLPVTILALGSVDGPIHIEAVEVRPELIGTEVANVSKGFEPFAPFTLSAGHEAAITAEVNVTDEYCADIGGYSSWSTVPITYRLLGITRHSDLQTGVEIRMVGTKAPRC